MESTWGIVQLLVGMLGVFMHRKIFVYLHFLPGESEMTIRTETSEWP